MPELFVLFEHPANVITPMANTRIARRSIMVFLPQETVFGRSCSSLSSSCSFLGCRCACSDVRYLWQFDALGHPEVAGQRDRIEQIPRLLAWVLNEFAGGKHAGKRSLHR